MPVDLVDQATIEKLAAGDPIGLAELYDRYYKLVFCRCFSILAHREDAEDATQEAFLRASEKISSFSGRCALSSWLFQVASRVALNLRHENVAGGQIPLEDLEDEDMHGPKFDPVPRIALDKALQEIPRRDRMFWRKRTVDGLSPTEIAAESGVSVALVANALHTTRRRLRLLLSGQDPQ